MWTAYDFELSDDPEEGPIPPSSEWTLAGWPGDAGEASEEKLFGDLSPDVTRHEITFDTQPAVLLVVPGHEATQSATEQASDMQFAVPAPITPGGECLLRAIVILTVIGGVLGGLGYLVVLALG